MKISKIACAVATASLTLSGVAFAQGGPNPPDDGRDAALLHQQQQRGGNQDRNVDTRHDQDRHVETHYDRHDDRHEGRGAGPDHRFYSGDRLPSQYRSRQYVVDDWRGHDLKAPPRGYQWVDVGGDYVLAAIATGIIVSVLLNSQ